MEKDKLEGTDAETSAKLKNASAEPDYQEADRFLKTIGRGRNRFTFQTWDDQKRGRVEAKKLYGTLNEHFDELSTDNQAGAGICVMLNPGDQENRSERNVTSIEWVRLDLDGSPLQPVLDAEIQPHIVTRTSIPTNRGESDSKFSTPLRGIPITDENRRELKTEYGRVQMALCERFNGDPKVTKIVCGVMRVPGFFHQKRQPQLIELILVNDHPSL